MSRHSSSIRNTFVALISEIVVSLVGILLPQAIILAYGSQTSGLITSIQQLVQYFTLVESGLAGAAIFSLYKPLAENNSPLINRILFSVRRVYRKLGWIFILVVIVASSLYPAFTASVGYPYWMISLLFCMLSLNGATQLLFIGKYKVLLNATQNSRYVTLLNSISTCLFSVTIIICSSGRLHILLTIALGTLTYLLRSLGYYIVIRKKFPQYTYGETSIEYRFEHQREVFIQQILTMIAMNSGILVLSFAKTDMAEISIFSVYNMVLMAVFLFTNAVSTGVSASFGDLIARHDRTHLQRTYGEYEVLYLIFWTVIFACTSILYEPFISVYSQKINDVEYVRPTLCLLFSIYGAVWSIRMQQSVFIVAAGKFKEIQKTSIVEALLTVVLSVVGLRLGHIEGLMVGRIVAATYRMIDLTQFNHRYVLKMSSALTWKGIVCSIAVIVGINLLVGYSQLRTWVNTYPRWILLACGTAFVSGTISIIMNVLLYPTEANRIVGRIKEKLRVFT